MKRKSVVLGHCFILGHLFLPGSSTDPLHYGESKVTLNSTFPHSDLQIVGSHDVDLAFAGRLREVDDPLGVPRLHQRLHGVPLPRHTADVTGSAGLELVGVG